MISRKTLLRGSAGLGLALFFGGLGCLSMQSQTSLDGGSAATNTAIQPYVEAYVEYPGPQQKWVGPTSFILHVTARDAGAAQITTTPALLTGEENQVPQAVPPELSRRAPAASAISLALPTAIHAREMSGEAARDYLAHLATALQGVQAPFRGCMSPVRIRLVRADGGLFERQGCRSELGWSRAVSETVSAFVEMSWHGTSVQSTQGTPKNAQLPRAASRSIATSADRH